MRDPHVKRPMVARLERGDATVHELADAARVTVRRAAIKAAQMVQRGQAHVVGKVDGPSGKAHARCNLYRLGPGPKRSA